MGDSMTRKYIQAAKYSLFTLLGSELADRFPTTESVTYWDFSAGAEATKTITLAAFAGIYRHPVSVESQTPFLCMVSENLRLPRRTQPAQEEGVYFGIQIWDLDFNLEDLDDRITAYSAVVTRAVEENAVSFVDATADYGVLDIYVEEQMLMPSIAGKNEQIIRAALLPVRVQLVEE